MTPEIQKIEDSIKKVHRVAFTPKYKDSFQTKLSKSEFIAVALRAIEKIGWEIVYYDAANIEAKRKNDWDTMTENIVIQYDFGNVNVISKSLGNEMWDFGRNSLRVKLFQLVFQNLESELNKEEIHEIESAHKKLDNWEEYQLPESLPAPIPKMKPNYYIPLFSTIAISLILGFMLAFSITNGLYIIGLFDVAVGFVIGFILSQSLKLGNYTNFKKLRVILIASVIISFLSSQIFIYKLYTGQNPSVQTDFVSFMKLRFEAGLTIKSLNTGWIGLLISWCLLLFFGYYIGLLKLISGVIVFQLNRIPPEVLDFAVYHVIKGKNEDQIKEELSKYGWSNIQDQNYVLEAVAAVGDAQEIRRT